jgi:hypothetical protein
VAGAATLHPGRRLSDETKRIEALRGRGSPPPEEPRACINSASCLKDLRSRSAYASVERGTLPRVAPRPLPSQVFKEPVHLHGLQEPQPLASQRLGRRDRISPFPPLLHPLGGVECRFGTAIDNHRNILPHCAYSIKRSAVLGSAKQQPGGRGTSGTGTSRAARGQDRKLAPIRALVFISGP